ncbi:MAG: hypothetical protein EOP04_10885 [Proteobacteria bacterium]|nr:MAG: hypothetical protein EOP04_10885 [Pseudomonadota bacterium]
MEKRTDLYVDWVYRAYRYEGAANIRLNEFHHIVKVLIENITIRAGWIIVWEIDNREFMTKEPLGKILLQITTLVELLVSADQKQEFEEVKTRFELDGDSLVCKFSLPVVHEANINLIE